MKDNPYTLSFGIEPTEQIPRIKLTSEILDTFTAEIPSQYLYIITGIRGSGKTVLMTSIANNLRENDDWIVVELNPERDLLESLAAKLASDNALATIFQSAKINLSAFGIGLEVKGGVPITDIEVALQKMLESLKRKKKRILVTIDEVSGTKQMKIFASAFQIFIRQKLPIFLLMTGLHENIKKMKDEDALTFLYRAPVIQLEPLNLGTIATNYSHNLNVGRDTALEMARTTKGYAFAFQVLGYLTWDNGGNYKEILPEYRQRLEEYVYDKVWTELSGKDKQVAIAIVKSQTGKAEDIRQLLDLKNNEYAPYRRRLIKKGIVDGSEHGKLKFALPYFDEYVKEHYS